MLADILVLFCNLSSVLHFLLLARAIFNSPLSEHVSVVVGMIIIYVLDQWFSTRGSASDQQIKNNGQLMLTGNNKVTSNIGYFGRMSLFFISATITVFHTYLHGQFMVPLGPEA